MKKKNLIYSIVSFAIVLTVYCVLFLAIPFRKTASSWVSFAFTLLALCLCGAVLAYALRGKDIKSKLYGFPVVKVALLYAAIQLLAGIVMCVIAAFVDVPLWISIVIYILLLAAGALGFIATDSAKTAVEHIDDATITSTRTFARLQAQVAGIADNCSDAATRQKIMRLQENLRYSDPVSCPETESAENDLQLKIEQLATMVKNKSFDQAGAVVEDINTSLAERNRLCAMSKK